MACCDFECPKCKNIMVSNCRPICDVCGCDEMVVVGFDEDYKVEIDTGEDEVW
jgi:hypothetical protein